MSGGGRRRLLAFAQDAGGARALAPVVRRLLGSPGWEVLTVTHLFADEVFREAGLEAAPLAERADEAPLGPGGASRLLEREAPAALVCTASENRYDPSNGELIRAAGRAGVPSFALMDHWKGWGRLHGEPGDFRYLPALLGVIDRASFERGVREGIPPGRMAVVGHPHLESLSAARGGNREAIRSALGVSPEEFVCAFFSQPAVGASAGGPLVRSLLEGKSGEAVGVVVHRLLSRLGGEGRRARFLIRLHPRERAGGSRPSLPPGAEWADESVPALDIARAADLVLGLDSMILYEALVCGRPVLSLRFGGFTEVPGAFEGDPGLLPRGWSLAEVDAFVEDQLMGKAPRGGAGYPLPTGSPGACEQAIRGLIESSGRIAARPEEARR